MNFKEFLGAAETEDKIVVLDIFTPPQTSGQALHCKDTNQSQLQFEEIHFFGQSICAIRTKHLCNLDKYICQFGQKIILKNTFCNWGKLNHPFQ